MVERLWEGKRLGLPTHHLIIGMLCLALAGCASSGDRAQRRLERAQTKVFEASYEEVFPAVADVLSQDYALTRVEPTHGAIETAPKYDVALNTGEFQGVYSLKIRAAVTRLEEQRTEVRLRVLAGKLLDFVENRWLYKDFGTPKYYEEYFRLIETALVKQ
ncbi:MAG: hypothetical protein RX316_05980 [bacterium]|nr:hypothetical protein [bacterium]